MRKRKIHSVIMGGGRGTRLHPLTKHRCKPAVPLAGKFRLVDIPISNCINSGLNQIYILSQFNTESLHKHILDSYKFDNFGDGFVEILSAEQTESGEKWYQGTADAVRQNLIHFGADDDDLFVILSGDQLYKMDVSEMIAHHEKMGADVTIAAKPIGTNLASEFGLLHVDNEYNIKEFVEKPQDQAVIDNLIIDPSMVSEDDKAIADKHVLASMGIYVFNAGVLKKALASEHDDFGKEVIPGLLGNSKLCSYFFNGYWEDIGTIRAFFDANLSLCGENPPFDFYDEEHKIFTHARNLPASKVLNCKGERIILAGGVHIRDAELKNCIIGVRSTIMNNCKLENVILMGADSYEDKDSIAEMGLKGIPQIGIGDNANIKNAIIDKNARIGNNVTLSPEGKEDGFEKDGVSIRDGILVVAKNSIIPDNTTI